MTRELWLAVPLFLGVLQEPWSEAIEQLLEDHREGDRRERQEVAVQLEEILFEFGEFLDRQELLRSRAASVVASDLPDLDSADRHGYLLEACRAGFASENPELAILQLWRRALLRRDEGRFEEALSFLDLALALFPEDRNYRPHVLHLRAEVQRQLGSYEDAFEDLTSALAAATEGRFHASVRQAAPALRAQLFLDLGLPDRAAPFVKEAQAQAEELRDQGVEAAATITAAHLCEVNRLMAVGGFEAAIGKIHEFLADSSLYDRVPAQRLHLRMRELTARFHRDRRNPGAFSQTLKLARDLVQDPELREPDRVDGWLLIADMSLRRGDAEDAARAIAAASSGLGNDASSNEGPMISRVRRITLEGRLALSQPTQVGREKAQAEAEVVLEEMLDRWSRVPRRAAGTGFLLYSHRRDFLAVLLRLQLAQASSTNPREECLNTLLRVQAAGELVRKVGGVSSTPVVGDVVDALLESGRGLLLYLPASPISLALAVDQHGIVIEELPDKLVLDDAVKEFSSRLLFGKSDGVGGDSLSRLLFPSSLQERIASWHGITVVGADLLGSIPFESLSRDGLAPLGTQVALDYLPSLALGIGLERRRREDPENRGLALVTEPEVSAAAKRFDSGLEELTLTDDWRRALREPYGPSRTKLLLGSEATLSSVRTVASEVGVLQLLTHSVEDPARERRLGLVLSPMDWEDGLLWCEQVEQIAAPPLVLLTCCRSASGPNRSGDANVADMGGAWLAAGAQSVLMSSQDLQLEPTLEFSESIHRRLAAGLSPAQALRDWRAERWAVEGVASTGFLPSMHIVGLGHRSVAMEPPQSKRPINDVPVLWIAGGVLFGWILCLGWIRVSRGRGY